MTASELARGLAVEFRRRMAGEYVPRIGKCLQLLDELLGNDAIWRRPAPNCNSVGNLVLHLSGNVTQWIQSGLRGDADGRDPRSRVCGRGRLQPRQERLARAPDRDRAGSL